MLEPESAASKFRGLRPRSAAVPTATRPEQRAGVVRAAPVGLRNRSARPDAGAGRGDGRPAGAVRAGAHRRSPAFRCSASTGTSASRPTSRPTRPTPRASSTTTTRAAGRDRTPQGAGAGLYFQIADGECFVAGGMWMPARPGAGADPRGDRGCAGEPGRDRPGAGVPPPVSRLDREAMLTRLPRGFAEGHPAERWLRYKSFTATRMLTEREVDEPAAARRCWSGTSRRWCRWCGGSTGRSATGPGSGGTDLRPLDSVRRLE